MSARDRIRKFFQDNVGRVVTTHEIREVAGISEYARRIRELRDEEGLQIKSHRDRLDLKPGEYILETLTLKPALERTISPRLRSEILERNGFTCRECGSGANEVDPTNPSRRIRLHIDHEIPISQGGTDDPSNLRVLCSACNEGKSNLIPASESAKNLLARIRKSSRSVQMEVYKHLKQQIEAPRAKRSEK